MSDRIAERQKRIAAKMLEMKALVEKDADEDVSADDKEKFAALKSEIEGLKEGLALLKTIREMEAEHAEPADDDKDEDKSFAPIRKSFGIRTTARKAAPGIRAARFAMAASIAKANGSLNAGVRFAQDALGDDLVAKALNSTTQVDGGATIPQDFVAEMIDLLRAKAVVRGANPTIIPMPMGQLTLPRLQAAATAQWQDELTAIAASQPAMDNLYLSAKKLTALVAASNDLIRRSPLSVEAILSQDMVKQIALAEDKAFLFGTGSANQPSGIDTLVASGNKFTNAVTSPTLGTVNDVLMSLELALTSKNVDTSSARFFFHPSVRSFLSTLTDSTGRYFFREELEQGRLLGYPVSTSTQFVTNTGTGPNYNTKIVFANMDDMIIGDTLSMKIDSSDVASYVQSSTTYSAFTMDQTIFRCIEEVDFNMRHDVSAAVATVTNWRPTGFTVDAGTQNYAQTANTTGSAAKSAKP